MKIQKATRSKTFRTKWAIITLAVLVAAGLSIAKIKTPVPEQSLYAAKPEGSASRFNETYGKLPLSFELNAGQTDDNVRFFARGAGYALFLTEDEAVLSLRGNQTAATPSEPTPKQNVLRMKLAGAVKAPEISGIDEQEGKANYFIGNDPAEWRSNVNLYNKVRYKNVYAGVDQIYYGNQGQLEYDFVVAPHADHEQIGLHFDGAETVSIDRTGDLLLTFSDGSEVRQLAPYTYQEVDGQRLAITSNYVKKQNGVIGFEVAEYDPNLPLVIDPILVYSTYLGGSANDRGTGIALDPAGNAYITGSTESTNFPTAGPFQGANAATTDAFVTKINASGSALVYSTYLGGSPTPGQGSSLDRANGIAVDSAGNAYVVGETNSYNFPVANAFQPTMANNTNPDGFVTKLNASGSALVYSTYLGGNGSFEWANAVAVDAAGSAYVTGFTGSTDFPTVGPIQAALVTGTVDVFVTKFNPAGSALVYSTYLGGNGQDTGLSIAIDPAGNAFVSGRTVSTNFPTVNPLQPAFGGGVNDGFVTMLNPPGSAIVYSTYLGGTGSDTVAGIVADSSGNAYVTGDTMSDNFPLLNPLQNTRGSVEAFLTKINSSGSTVFSTFHGAPDGADLGTAVAVDASGNAYVVGYTFSNSFPVVDPIQPGRGSNDVFVTKFNASGSARIYSTLFGGSSDDISRGIALDPSGNPHITGYTSSLSNNFPLFSIAGTPFQSTMAGGTDAFIARIDSMAPAVKMASQPGLSYTEDFNDIADWRDAFTLPVDARVWRGVALNSTGTIPDGVRTSQSTAVFQAPPTGVSTQSGIQRGSFTGNPPGTIVLLAASQTPDNTSANAIDIALDYTGVSAGTLSFDWASVNNATGNRNGSLRIYTSTDGATFTELPGAAVLDFTNNAPTSGSVANVQLPASFDNVSTCLVRFYQYNGTGGTTGSRPKLSIDNVTVTAAPPTAAGVTVSGRVLTSEGRGVRGAVVSIADSNGQVRNTMTGPLGIYRFDDIPTGEIYIVTPRSRRFEFESRVVKVYDNLTDIDFVAGKF